MKKFIMLPAFLFLLHFASAQKVPYNVVFDVTTKDTVVHQMVMRWVKEIVDADPQANVEVVFYAKSLDMITKDKSVVADDVMKYSSKVAFRVCEAAMKRNEVDKSMLLTGVGTVPDGIYEIIKKQHEGYGYIKASR